MSEGVAPQPEIRFYKRARVWQATAAMLLFFFLAVSSMVGDSPTMDEQNHIARGLAFLKTGDPRLSLEHPPFVNSLSATLLLTMPELRLPIDHPSWERREGWYEFADLFLWQYNRSVNRSVERIVFLARLPIVFLTLALALVGYRFAGRLWGTAASIPALLLFLFEPNLLAHGRYATTDIGGVFFSFLTTFLLWRLWKECESRGGWNWRLWLAVVVSMGLAFGSKLSSLGFMLIWAVMALLPLYATLPQRYARAALRRLIQLLTAGAASLAVLWAIFGFEWGRFAFVSPALEKLNSWSGPMPIFWAGLEQIARLGKGRSTVFMLGRFSDDGFRAYFPVAFALKTPVLLILLLLIAGGLLLYHHRTRRRVLLLLTPAAGFYLLAMTSALNIGYRHVLPALPYLLLLVSGLASPDAWPESVRSWRLFRRFGPSLLAASLAVFLATTLWIHPHYLSYFNLLAGGPRNGYRALTDSNVDWGQDLLRLRSWMVENGVDHVNLGWFGTADPAYYGISNTPMPGLGRDVYFRQWWELPFDPVAPQPGVYAISASSLSEPPLRAAEKTVYAWFREHEPEYRIGYSIFIYDVR